MTSLAGEFRRRLAAARRYLRAATGDRARTRRDIKELTGRPIALARLRVEPTLRRCPRCAARRSRRS